MDTALQTRLGSRYRIERALGQGGMGTVYLALDTRLNRHVAIKSLSAAAASEPGALERFRVEVDATARLRHPHIVQIMDMGLEAPPFMVLEVLAGESLRARLIKEPVLSPVRACMIMTQVLSALAAAHQAHIVHRDIKPANIFLVDTPPPGVFAKVLDFGVARLLVAERMTQAGQSVGSVPYMSPEQHRGLEVTGSSDLFTCGLVLYEMLSGRRPFLGRTIEEGVYMMLSGNVPVPIPNCPPELNALVLRAIAVDPARRFSNAQEMMTSIGAFVPRLTNLGSAAQAGANPDFATTVASRQSTHTVATSPAHSGAPATGAALAGHPPTMMGQPPPPHQAGLPNPGMVAPRRTGLALGIVATLVAALALGSGLAWRFMRSETNSTPPTSVGDSGDAPIAQDAEQPTLSPLASQSSSKGTTPSDPANAAGGSVAPKMLLDGGTSFRDAGSSPATDGGGSALDAGKAGKAKPVVGTTCTDADVHLRASHMYCKNQQVRCFEHYTDCGGADPCQDLGFTTKHCGACGKACGAGQFCTRGSCLDCDRDTRRAMCSGECVSIVENGNCGACGVTCAFPETCIPKKMATGFGCRNGMLP